MIHKKILFFAILSALALTLIPQSSLAQYQLKMIFPNGGEVLEAGKTYTVQPTSVIVGKYVSVYLNRYDYTGQRISREPICYRLTCVPGMPRPCPRVTPSCEFVVAPGFAGDDRLYIVEVKVEREDNGIISEMWTAQSANYFTIVIPTITVTAPVGTPTSPFPVLLPNIASTITWTRKGLETDKVSIYLVAFDKNNLAGGMAALLGVYPIFNYQVWAQRGSTGTQGGSINWTPQNMVVNANRPPNNVTAKAVYKILVKREASGSIRAVEGWSDGYFDVKFAAITVNFPARENKMLAYNRTYSIKWQQAGLSRNNVNIYLAAFDINRNLIGFYPKATVSAAAGIWQWTPRTTDVVANAVYYRILVKYEGAGPNYAVEGWSDGYFKLSASDAPFLRLSYPTGCSAATVRKGKICEIRWTSNRVQDVILWANRYKSQTINGTQVQLKNPVLIDAISASEGGSEDGFEGGFKWTVLPSMMTGTYKIEIGQWDNVTQPIVVESGNFTITDPIAKSGNFLQRAVAAIIEALSNFFKK